MLDPALGYLLLGAYALLFAGAGAHKVRGFARFAETFAAYRVLPQALVRGMAWLVPCVELAIAAALLWPPSRRAGVAAAVGVLIAYALAIALNLRRGRLSLDCGCGPVRERRPIAWWMVGRNLLLALGLGVTALPWSARALGATDGLTVAGGLAAATALYVALDQLLGEVAPRARAMRGGS